MLHIDLYLIQLDSDVGQHPCEMQFGNFGGSSYEVIRDPGPNMQYSGMCNALSLSLYISCI